MPWMLSHLRPPSGAGSSRFCSIPLHIPIFLIIACLQVRRNRRMFILGLTQVGSIDEQIKHVCTCRLALFFASYEQSILSVRYSSIWQECAYQGENIWSALRIVSAMVYIFEIAPTAIRSFSS
jgi:hypothetical protein